MIFSENRCTLFGIMPCPHHIMEMATNALTAFREGKLLAGDSESAVWRIVKMQSNAGCHLVPYIRSPASPRPGTM
jgi:hypothetical protein